MTYVKLCIIIQIIHIIVLKTRLPYFHRITFDIFDRTGSR
jgi:hypothetical protein